VWDNFPDDLLKRDVENGTKALEIISVKDIMSLLVALKPKYMELYRGVTSKIPELYHFELAYDKERVKSIIASYGKNIIQFIDVYEKYILPNIHQVSTLLWQKEPLPITILAYYRELIAKSEKKGRSLDAILEAGKLMRRTEYYNHQFSLIGSLKDRQSDIEFLYILKLCYELSLNRSSALICQLQKEIFDSTPPKEPSRKLSTWIYLSGQYYAMHDAPGEAIQFSKDIKLKIISYLVQNFIKIIPSEDNRIYSFGIFFGRNIDFIASNPLLYQGPNHETVQKLLKKFGAKMEDIAKKFGQFNVDPIIVDELLQDGDMIRSLQVIHTPGHTPGHLSLYSKKHKIIFGADSLFKSVLGIDGLFIPTEVAIDSVTAAISVRRFSQVKFDKLLLSHQDFPILEDAQKFVGRATSVSLQEP
jgi:hypothetical protein